MPRAVSCKSDKGAWSGRQDSDHSLLVPKSRASRGGRILAVFRIKFIFAKSLLMSQSAICRWSRDEIFSYCSMSFSEMQVLNSSNAEAKAREWPPNGAVCAIVEV